MRQVNERERSSATFAIDREIDPWDALLAFGFAGGDGLTPAKLGSFWCAPKARVTSGGGFRPESCRLIW